jgi:hypothetical protein
MQVMLSFQQPEAAKHAGPGCDPVQDYKKANMGQSAYFAGVLACYGLLVVYISRLGRV